jgi:hypothetical protein
MLFSNAADVAFLAGADEGQKVVGLDRQALFPEHGDGGLVDQGLGIREHPVHVEDHRADV